MPKPVLSDSLFNADDVATAILSEANLQVSNNDLGVTEISNPLNNGIMTVDTTYTKMFKFNGFIFLQYRLTHSATPTSGDIIASIADSNNYPSYQVLHNSVAYQGESVDRIEIHTNGNIVSRNPDAAGDAGFRVHGNLFYRL